MIVRYIIDAAAATPRTVDVEIVDGINSPEAIAAESMLALTVLRSQRTVAPWRMAHIDSVDGRPWRGQGGEHERRAALVAATARNPVDPG